MQCDPCILVEQPTSEVPVRQRATLILCLLAALCEGIDLQAAGLAAIGIAPALQPSPAQLGLFFSSGTLGLFVGALAGGRLADSIGRRRVLIASVFLFGMFSLLTPLAADMSSLSALRVLTGLGLGGAFPNLIALVAESSEERRRSANVADVYSAAPAGAVLVSLLSLAAGPTHWQWIFIFGGILPLALVPLMIAMLPESPEFVRMRESSRNGTAAQALQPGSFLALFTDQRALRTVLLWLSFLFGLLTLFLLLNWLPTLLSAAGFSSAQVAGVQIGFNLGGALAAVLAGRLFESKARRATILTIFIALPTFLYLLAAAPADFLTLVVVVVLLGCSLVAAQAFFYTVAPALYPTRVRGMGVGAAVAIGRLGSIIGPWLGGMLIASGRNSSQLLSALLPIALLGSATAILLAFKIPAVAAPGAVPRPDVANANQDR
jgi:MFS transporter, AAHS family, 3-hydroxyphenylpropionic acid transporter